MFGTRLGGLFLSSEFTRTVASVVVNSNETLHFKMTGVKLSMQNNVVHMHGYMIQGIVNHLAASAKAVLTTFRGSIIPAFTISTYSPILANAAHTS